MSEERMGLTIGQRIRAVNPSSMNYEYGEVVGWWSEGMRGAQGYCAGPRVVFDSDPKTNNNWMAHHVTLGTIDR